jgi:hypothetical protein
MKYFHLFLLIGASWMSGVGISRAAIQIAHIQNCTEPGVNNGFIMAVATGNAGPFDFKWSRGATTCASDNSTTRQLSPGIYTVTITGGAFQAMLNLETYPQGIYFLRVTDGKRSADVKLSVVR